MTDHLTEGQLAQLVRYLARVSLEIERGLRPARHLEQVLHPSIASVWTRRRPTSGLPPGPVVARDIGPAHLSSTTPDRVLASVTVRTTPGRWGAISMELRQQDGRWLVTSLRRIDARRHNEGRRTTAPPVRQSLEQTAAHLRSIRDLATSAHDACSDQLAQVAAAHDSPQRSALLDRRRYWRTVIDDHDRQLAALDVRIQTQHALLRAGEPARSRP